MPHENQPRDGEAPLPLSIVVADDDEDDQYIIRQAIREVNSAHHCTIVGNGVELLDLLENGASHGPDLVLLDLNMPLLDGFSALQRIRDNAALKDLPVYVLTTSRHQSDIEKSKELGANAFYSKPSDFATMKKIIERACAIRRAA